jgi:hypothetical protein
MIAVFFILISIVFIGAFIILPFAGMWKTFEKAGKPGWAAIIPIYNYIVMAEISGKPTWWGVMVLVPLANIVFSIWLINVTIKSFGKDEAYTIGVLLLPFVFWPILGFSKDIQYQGPYCLRGQYNPNSNINNIGVPDNNTNNPYNNPYNQNPRT